MMSANELTPGGVAIMGLAASLGMRLEAHSEIALGSSAPMMFAEAASALDRVDKPIACAARNERDRLSVECTAPTAFELLILRERNSAVDEGHGVIGALQNLNSDAEIVLRGAGLEVRVRRSELENWSRDYLIRIPLAVGIEHSRRDSRPLEVVNFSAVEAVTKEDFLRQLRGGHG